MHGNSLVQLWGGEKTAQAWRMQSSAFMHVTNSTVADCSEPI
ncbi:hypothetical protein GJA_814 [Janthinobacterium agaricidamnosum NBRC 102515 = DSM 9628]|uniref:Uncharacterized protein n=1 Tax=Janthinobacterium agaricidamnosum NBRC 102515 = DSM 9628 TaxID=1349767 RepID=W0V2B2_9BURK|nr:hypothetical protein GJA_814 [Janthinobacterium agaricidamnosum NBRC 102515 = DSM 9628]